MRTEIELYGFEEKRIRIRDGWIIRPRGRFAKLQKWLWDKLVRADAIVPNYADSYKVRRVLLDGDGIVERIFQAKCEVEFANRRPTEILIGPATLRELVNDPAIRDTDMFTFHGTIGHGRGLYSLPVKVLPWMEGIAINAAA